MNIRERSLNHPGYEWPGRAAFITGAFTTLAPQLMTLESDHEAMLVEQNELDRDETAA